MPAATPAAFIGHGSPMNAIDDNQFTRAWRNYGHHITRGKSSHMRVPETPGNSTAATVLPKAVLVVSAHWDTRGIQVTANNAPRTIHDYSGFPPELSAVQYPAPGSPAIAQFVVNLLREFAAPEPVVSTQAWGLDHGTWSVLKHVFPEANVPVVQLSIDTSKPASWHLEVGRIIGKVREQQVLIVASGNIVHNLREINWSVDAVAHPAGVRFHDYIVEAIANGDDDALVNYAKHPDAAYAVPTPEHFLPLLYAVGARRPGEAPHTIVDGDVFSSLSMYSVSFG